MMEPPELTQSKKSSLQKKIKNYDVTPTKRKMMTSRQQNKIDRHANTKKIMTSVNKTKNDEVKPKSEKIMTSSQQN